MVCLSEGGVKMGQEYPTQMLEVLQLCLLLHCRQLVSHQKLDENLFPFPVQTQLRFFYAASWTKTFFDLNASRSKSRIQVPELGVANAYLDIKNRKRNVRKVLR